VPALLLAPPFSWWRTLILRPIVFAATFLLALGIMNHRALDNWNGFRGGLDRETEHALTGHMGIIMNQPNGFVLETTWREVPVHAWVLAAIFIVTLPILWRRRGGGTWWRESGWQIAALFFAIAWVIVLSYNTIPFRRYALPIIVMTYFFAALGAAALISKLMPAKAWVRSGAAMGIVGLVVAIQLPICLDFNRQYADDSRQHLKDWLNEHAQRGATVAGDRYAQLYSPPDPRSPKAHPLSVRAIQIDQVGKAWYVFGPGSLIDDLRRAGVRYVAISEPSYDRYLTPYTHGDRDGATEFERRRKFYVTLLNDWTPVWESQQKYPNGSFVNPKIRLYDLASRPTTQPRRPTAHSSP
jgi:hypothetical protein